MLISDILRRKGSDVVTIASDATVPELVAKLAEHKIGALVVPTLLGIGPDSEAFDADGAPVEPAIQYKVGQMVRELTHFSRGGI